MTEHEEADTELSGPKVSPEVKKSEGFWDNCEILLFILPVGTYKCVT